MSKVWILDVLADLKTFAHKNELPILAAHLEDSAIIAMAEIASTQAAANAAVKGEDGAAAGTVTRSAGARNNDHRLTSV